MQYRRIHTRGGVYFFTVVTRNREKFLADEAVLTALKSALQSVRASRPFSIDAIVVLPDHLHCIWTLSETDGDSSTRWRLIKAKTTRILGENIWQSRFWEHHIRDQNAYNRHIEYIHYNPVKHGLVDRAVDWPYSSIHRYLERGLDEFWEDGFVSDEKVGRE